MGIEGRKEKLRSGVDEVEGIVLQMAYVPGWARVAPEEDTEDWRGSEVSVKCEVGSISLGGKGGASVAHCMSFQVRDASAGSWRGHLFPTVTVIEPVFRGAEALRVL